MFHYFDTITNAKGDSLPGWQVECVQLSDGSTVVPIYADESGTPILTVSGKANRAVADQLGNYDFYVKMGTYSLRFYNARGVFQKTQRYLPMYGAVKSDVAALADQVSASAALVQTYGAMTPYPTWAVLNAVTGAANNMAIIFTDVGTHTDPVVGGTVSNSGIFSYSASPAGWQRRGNTEAADAATSAAAAAASASSLGGLVSSTKVADATLSPTGRNIDMIDGDGRVLFGLGAGGGIDSPEFVRGFIAAAGIDPTAAGIKRLPRLSGTLTTTDWRGVQIFGQSNASGAATAISTTQPYDSKKLNADNTALINLVEAPYESSASAFANESKVRLLDEVKPWDTFSPVHIVNNNGESGTVLTGIAKPSAVYTRCLADVTALVSLAATASKTYREYAVHFLHGESDANVSTAQATYAAGIIAFKNNWNTDVLAVTGQTSRIPFFMVQCSYSQAGGFVASTGPTLAMLDAVEADSEMHIIAPGYIFTLPDDGLHYGAEDQRRIGAYLEKAHWRYFYQRRSPSTVRPLTVKLVNNRTIDIKFFVPVPPLVWDIERVLLVDKDMGFQVLHLGVEVAIQGSPRIVKGASGQYDTVRLRMSADVVTGDVVTYALKRATSNYTGGQYAGRTKGPRGNLRDSDGTRSIYQTDANGEFFTLPNWSVIFSKVL